MAETLILSDRPLWHFRTVHFITFGPSTLTLSDRPLWHFLTVHFDISWPSTLTFSDRPVWHFRTVHFDSFGPSTSTLWFIPRDRPLLVEWPSTLTHDRPLWLKRPSTIVLDRPVWLKWPSSLAQDRPLLDGPSTFARPFTLRTVHFHHQIYNYDSKKYEWSRYKKINLDSIILQWFLKLMDIFSHQWRSNVVPEIRILGFLLDCFQKWH